MLFLEKTKRIIIPDGVYFVTVNTEKHYPYFKEEILCELWVAELQLCKELKKFELIAFCLNYDHFHMLLKPSEGFDISKVMFSLKKQFSHDANRVLGFNPPFPVDGQTFGRLQREHQMLVEQWKQQFLSKHGHHHTFPRFRWQRSFYDHIIRDERDAEEHYKYTAYNFDKHELPENWKYTSLNFSDFTDKL